LTHFSDLYLSYRWGFLLTTYQGSEVPVLATIADKKQKHLLRFSSTCIISRCLGITEIILLVSESDSEYYSTTAAPPPAAGNALSTFLAGDSFAFTLVYCTVFGLTLFYIAVKVVRKYHARYRVQKPFHFCR
jgi:hypothetical protein